MTRCPSLQNPNYTTSSNQNINSTLYNTENYEYCVNLNISQIVMLYVYRITATTDQFDCTCNHVHSLHVAYESIQIRESTEMAGRRPTTRMPDVSARDKTVRVCRNDLVRRTGSSHHHFFFFSISSHCITVSTQAYPFRHCYLSMY